MPHTELLNIILILKAILHTPKMSKALTIGAVLMVC